MSESWYETVCCPVCGSDEVDGVPVDDGIELPNPENEDQPLIGYDVVSFLCRGCGHRWEHNPLYDFDVSVDSHQPRLFDDNPPITCPLCGSTDQEYIYAGEWICGDCGKHWNERWSDDLDPASNHSQGDQGDGRWKDVILPNPFDGHSQRDQGDDEQGGAESGDGSGKAL